MADHSPSLTRRTFVKTTGALGVHLQQQAVFWLLLKALWEKLQLHTRIHQKLLHGANVM